MTTNPEMTGNDFPGVPTVSFETLESLVASKTELGGKYYDEVSERLTTEQPYLEPYVATLIRVHGRSEYERGRMVEVVMLVYDALTRQIEANAMNGGSGSSSIGA